MAEQMPVRNQLGWGVEGCGRTSNSISLSVSENKNSFHACISRSLAAFFQDLGDLEIVLQRESP